MILPPRLTMALEAQIPMLYQGGLTGRWWCATKWKHIKNDHYEVIEKFDVTDQIGKIVAAALRAEDERRAAQ